MRTSTLKLEKKLLRDGYDLVIGIDEAGRGPLAGPVVASAVTLKRSSIPIMGVELPQLSLVRDSKTLSEKQRESLYDFILENFHIGIGICDHKMIDRVNILQATFLAMKKAMSDLKRKLIKCHSRAGSPRLSFGGAGGNLVKNIKKTEKKVIILVDGNKKIPNLSIEQKAIIGGDKLVKTISAASIIAKVTRDRIMHKMHKIYPDYCFDRHKGYGTRQHFKMLKKYGLCKIHRKSFNLVSSIM